MGYIIEFDRLIEALYDAVQTADNVEIILASKNASDAHANNRVTYGTWKPNEEQIEAVCKIHMPKKWQRKEVYECLKGRIGGKQSKITGAFIANLADNIKEMEADNQKWTLDDTISLIEESYKGFYASQISSMNDGMGFVKTNE